MSRTNTETNPQVNVKQFMRHEVNATETTATITKPPELQPNAANIFGLCFAWFLLLLVGVFWGCVVRQRRREYSLRRNSNSDYAKLTSEENAQLPTDPSGPFFNPVPLGGQPAIASQSPAKDQKVRVDLNDIK